MKLISLKLEVETGVAEMRVARTNWNFNPAFLVLLRDVTERKQAQEELRQSEFRLNRAEVLAGTGNWEIDLSTKRITISDGARKIYGIGQEVSTLDDMRKFPLPEYRSELDRALHALIKDGTPYDMQFKINRANDNQVIDIRSIAHYDPEKNFVFGAIHDITNLIHAEQNRMLLFEAINQSADATIITDSAGIIQYVNPAQEMLSGYSLDEFVGQTPNILRSDFHEANSYKQLSEAIGVGKAWSGRFVNKRKDGTEYHEDATISPVYDKSGELTNFVVIEHDVTEQLQLQEQLFQAQKMESIGTLAGGIAHDFNNILTIVFGFAELMLFDMDKDTTSNIIILQNVADSGSKRGADLVQGPTRV